MIYTDPGDQPRGARKRRPNPGPTRDADDLFSQSVLETPTAAIAGMVRGTDSIESQRAAVDVVKDCAWIRWRIMCILVAEGPQTARQLENRNEFRGFALNTIRRRVTDLKQAAERGEAGVVQVGRLDKMAQWGISPEKHDG